MATKTTRTLNDYQIVVDVLNEIGTSELAAEFDALRRRAQEQLAPLDDTWEAGTRKWTSAQSEWTELYDAITSDLAQLEGRDEPSAKVQRDILTSIQLGLGNSLSTLIKGSSAPRLMSLQTNRLFAMPMFRGLEAVDIVGKERADRLRETGENAAGLIPFIGYFVSIGQTLRSLLSLAKVEDDLRDIVRKFEKIVALKALVEHLESGGLDELRQSAHELEAAADTFLDNLKGMAATRKGTLDLPRTRIPDSDQFDSSH